MNLANFHPLILRETFSYIENKRDLQCLRVVCKSFEKCASQFLFKTATYAPRYKAMKRLTKIANHPEFCLFVTELIYDMDIYDLSTADKEDDLNEEVARTLEELDIDSDDDNDDWEDPLSVHRLRVKRAKLYRQFLDDQEEIWLKGLGKDCLKNALNLMPNITVIRLSSVKRVCFIPDRVREWSYKYSYHTDRGLKIKFDEAAATAPHRPALDNNDVPNQWSAYAQLLDSLTPETASRTQTLKCTLTPLKAKPNGFPINEFYLPDTHHNLGLQLFKNLLHVHFDLDRHFAYSIESSNALGHLLASAQALKTLHLTFHATPPLDNPELHQILYQSHWPCLTTLSLTSLKTTFNALLPFLRLHKPSLRYLTLCSIFLHDAGDPWSIIIEELKNEFELQDLRLVSLSARDGSVVERVN